MSVVENQEICGVDYAGGVRFESDYEACRFIGCRFVSTDLSGLNFDGCRFENCDLSMALLMKTAFRNVCFTDCKLLGLRFEDCNRFGLSFVFRNCILQFSSFYRLKLKGIRFETCKLNEVDFTEADLSGALFSDCDLTAAVFDRTILEKADFRTAYRYAIHPENNRIKGARFAFPGVLGLLARYDIDIETL